ncbi:hypothetical protein SLEP1_g4490 [Rubroshorea leprosula]|uniref:Uncharacterized protein n=1 Tax=Rubroshorea leprosula TaxID=152421 RepID=A0AAV5HNV0_9ROSI|nr:hypothetical protein SLEP1_g4490 [Rubroshorea leprosula]
MLAMTRIATTVLRQTIPPVPALLCRPVSTVLPNPNANKNPPAKSPYFHSNNSPSAIAISCAAAFSL